MICKDFLPFSLPFPSAVSLVIQIFNLTYPHLSFVFAFVPCAFGVKSKKFLSGPVIRRWFSSMFTSRNFTVLGLGLSLQSILSQCFCPASCPWWLSTLFYFFVFPFTRLPTNPCYMQISLHVKDTKPESSARWILPKLQGIHYLLLIWTVLEIEKYEKPPNSFHKQAWPWYWNKTGTL